jgi:2-methylaconitate isomerase
MAFRQPVRRTQVVVRGDQVALPACYVRGGTSRAVIFHREDLPPLDPTGDYSKWNPTFLAAMGSPDPGKRQLDGFGGGISSLSKVAVISPSSHPEADVDYLFGQVGVDAAVVGYRANCGNISSAVGPFAVDEGLVKVAGQEARVRIHNVNTGKIIVSTFRVTDGYAAVEGDFALQGVAGTGSPIRLAFQHPGGAATGKLLPSGQACQRLDIPGVGPLTVSLVDAANPVVFVRGEELGLDFAIGPKALADSPSWLERFEAIRIAAAVAMGLVEREEEARTTLRNLPMVSIIYPPREIATLAGEILAASSCDVVSQVISAGSPHLATPLTGAMCLACASVVPGTVVAEIAGAAAAGARPLRIGHPSGVIDLSPVVKRDGESVTVEEVAIYRTARRLMEGHVLVPRRHYTP